MTNTFPRYFTWGRVFNPVSGYYRMDSENKGTCVSANGERKGPSLAFCLERVGLGDLLESTKDHIDEWIGRSPAWRAASQKRLESATDSLSQQPLLPNRDQV